MTKENTICFRTSRHLYESLVKAAKKDRRSLSSMIETVLKNHLKEREAFRDAAGEKRRHPRKALGVPAVIQQSVQGLLAVGAVEDISLGGVRVFISKDFNQHVLVDSHGTKFDLVFNVPPENKPVKISCESTRVAEVVDGIHIGAFFVDADFKSYKALQAYVI